MTRGLPFLIAGLWLGALCLGLSVGCAPRACGLPALTIVGWSLEPASLAAASGILAAAALLRAAWLLASAAAEVRRLPRLPTPGELTAIAASHGVRRVRVFSGRVPTAFCTGMLRPSVMLSDAALAALAPDELPAVLLHEASHAGSGEPLRRALRRAAADVLFFLPIVRWWADRRAARSELEADRAAVERLGARPVAGALLALEAPAALAFAGMTGMAGATDLRAAQLLGDPAPAERPPVQLLLRSAVGGYLLLALLTCITRLLVG